MSFFQFGDMHNVWNMNASNLMPWSREDPGQFTGSIRPPPPPKKKKKKKKLFEHFFIRKGPV